MPEEGLVTYTISFRINQLFTKSRLKVVHTSFRHSGLCTPEQNRTVTIITDNKILSLARLPISPPGYFVVRRGIEPRTSH